MPDPQESEAMRLAIVLSAYGLGTTSPNPPVGCVILNEGEIVGTGYHQRKGEAHAETIALNDAGIRARGATAVVTLEPCNHVGRTPACRQALLDAGISRVVIAVIDPTSRGEGGAAVLRANGVDVQVGLLADEAHLVLASWLAALKLGRPTVTAAFVGDDEDPRSESDLVEQLRPAFDVLVHDNGRTIEEGIPHGHGRDAFRLPAPPLAGIPADALKDFHAGGARSILLVGTGLAEAYTAADLADALIILGRHARPPRDLENARGFSLRSVERVGPGVKTHWTRRRNT
jgi:diaminohydroxyphosphoribosylaminopyrimidine deaminase/5-amino-6-(5-phosphoribosylamino)uracil reductase